jgi:hypothetical protein
MESEMAANKVWTRTLVAALALALMATACGDDDDDSGSSSSTFDTGISGSDGGGSSEGCGELRGACFNPPIADDPDSRPSCAEYRGVSAAAGPAFQQGCEQGEATQWFDGQTCVQRDASLNFGCEVPLGAGQGCSVSWTVIEADELEAARAACASQGATPRP